MVEMPASKWDTVSGLSLESETLLWRRIQEGYIFAILPISSLCLPIPWGRRRFFSDPHHENVVGLLEEKTLQSWGALWWLGPQVFLSHTSPYSASSYSSQLLVKLSGHTLIGPLTSVFSLWMHLSLQISGCGLPWNLNSVMYLRKVIDFQLVQIFLVRKWCFPSFLHVRVETRSLQTRMKFHFSHQTSKLKNNNIKRGRKWVFSHGIDRKLNWVSSFLKAILNFQSLKHTTSLT